MIRKAKAIWRGTGRDGRGNLTTDSGVLDDPRNGSCKPINCITR